jgi:hypothetical protein
MVHDVALLAGFRRCRALGVLAMATLRAAQRAAQRAAARCD